MKKNNNLRIDKISLTEAGAYYCWKDEGSQAHATDDTIISRIDLIVVALTDAKYGMVHKLLVKKHLNSVFLKFPEL